MAKGTDFYREADLRKFTRVGVIVVVVVALAGWLFYRHANNEIRADNRDATGSRNAPVPVPAPAPAPRPDADTVGDRIQNWNRNQAPAAPPAR
jgi:hypothetical protein